MIDEHNIREKINVSKFIEKLNSYGYDNIEATKHTFFRLSEKQRKIYTEEKLKKIISTERPLEVSLQKNGNYAIIYNFKSNNQLLKILIDLGPNKVYIVTFYILNREQIKDFKNG